jgi:hypothetical protein
LIAKLGVLKPGSPIGIAQLYDRYKRGDEETIWRLADMQSSGDDLQKITTEERWLLKCHCFSRCPLRARSDLAIEEHFTLGAASLARHNQRDCS